ncbi:MAG: HU family DNA-binding protein [Clostridiales bacterium]|nr:HU family DNA-binding protein [Clostridiales bacterium]
MNKSELAASIAEKANLSKKDAEAAVAAFIASVEDALKAGEKIQLVGFGTFEVRERSERQGRNPQTGKTVTIPASKVPAFKAGKSFKEAISK